MRRNRRACHLVNRMILVRNRNGTLYFLAREEDDAAETLRRSYPGRLIVVLMKGEGLSLLRVGEPGRLTGDDEVERLAIVNLVLPPVPAALSFRR